MKTIPNTASFSDVKSFASTLYFDVIEVDIGFELWHDESYKGGFPSLAALIETLNVFISLDEDARAEALAAAKRRVQEAMEQAQQRHNSLNTLLAGATEAAIMQDGNVIGLCRSIQRAGLTIEVAGELTAEGAPVNLCSFRLSRSVKNLKAAQFTSLYSPRMHEGFLFYVK
ncbi:hypothetical protein C6H68_23035 [Photorhabdus luminescens]|uniref:Uncharacterized protein n=1 Tax=Photorhabdus bodei TaxID=2029681 RepID=A0AAW6BR40_9GAMM|nr:hypothetical protein [Photorhabdus bodei]MDB6375066.1 hypothetical protein [Photorhabdus bodei]PQQ35790.1 hypothetical protein C6H68_23035 [Photorhabdus luminescens]